MKSEQLVLGTIFILGFSYFTSVQLMKPVEKFPIRNTNSYVQYSSIMKACPSKNYHRYGSNLCDPQQDELPITLPDPNAKVPPLELTRDQMMFQQVKYGSMSELGGINLCQ